MLGVDGRAFRATWTVLVALGLAGLVWLVREALLVMVLAVLFAYVVWPLVAVAERLCKRAWPRLKATRLAALAVVYPVLITAAVFDDVPEALAAHTVRIEAGRIVATEQAGEAAVTAAAQDGAGPGAPVVGSAHDGSATSEPADATAEEPRDG